MITGVGWIFDLMPITPANKRIQLKCMGTMDFVMFSKDFFTFNQFQPGRAQ